MRESPPERSAEPDRILHATTTTILAGGVVAILRATDSRHFPRVVETLVSAGVTAVEITLTSRGALRCLEEVTRNYAGGPVVIGAGTVLDEQQAEQCIAAGATFLMSPLMSVDVVTMASAAGVPMYPGALTPSEIFAAYRHGVDAVKLFPASAVSARYIREIRAPLPGAVLIPTGGVTVEDIPEWISSGAGAVGLGRTLIGDAADCGPSAGFAERARRAVNLVAKVRDRSG